MKACAGVFHDLMTTFQVCDHCGLMLQHHAWFEAIQNDIKFKEKK